MYISGMTGGKLTNVQQIFDQLRNRTSAPVSPPPPPPPAPTPVPIPIVQAALPASVAPPVLQTPAPVAQVAKDTTSQPVVSGQSTTIAPATPAPTPTPSQPQIVYMSPSSPAAGTDASATATSTPATPSNPSLWLAAALGALLLFAQ